MALDVDGKLPDLTPHMELQAYGRQQRGIMGVIRDGATRPTSRPWAPRQGAITTRFLPAKDRDQEKSSHKKTVTMAPRSRYLTSQSQYCVRKPLFVTECHVSILKKPGLPEQSEQVEQPNRPCELPSEEVELPSSPLGEETLGISNLLRSDASAPPAGGEDCSLPLTVAELCDWSSYEEPGTGSDFSAGGSHHRSLSSPPLDICSLTVPLHPRWSSAQRSHSLDALGLSSRPFWRGAASDPGSLLVSSQCRPPALRQMSPHQARYWACAIPSTKPPCPDRTSPSWDPNKEYQALLDYTYPLRPNLPSSQDSIEPGSLLWADPLVEDSGIEMDRFCSSTTLSYGELPPAGGSRDASSKVPNDQEHQDQPLRDNLQPKSPDSKLSSSWQSLVDQVGFSADSLLDSDGSRASHWMHNSKPGLYSSSSTAATFNRSACILPPAGAPWDGEEEFHPLPGRLRELEVLSQHLRELSLKASSESLLEDQSHARATPPPVEDRRQLPVREECTSGPSVIAGEESVSRASCSPEVLAARAVGLATSLENLSREVGRESLEAAASYMDHPSETKLPEFHRRTKTGPEEAETKESLVQHIQVFCSNLEELILWLYRVVDGIQNLTPAAPDIRSVRSCLASYKSFQKDISARQPLTTAVLKTGDALLSYLNSTSPVLRDTLALIEKQSEALETHTDHFFSSILLAMDSLIDPQDPKAGAAVQRTKT
ncbi:centrosomal protein of 68 kDa isoform X1 [Brienomyrus brachyistius]|uniref:centrosomal protein of 68 kDa isoform X1 n=2 Tax=Brienomyrus brachyistius TaxID=42636 RepID=UPI0020B1A4D2|nr:centrosomal protein of 68 kDa isoform X1 [Brienomyrus brachyistius]XP_048862750.1 centrosomal protein of 68 kDa isoform X1 [Brienomyrus brachyistius]XP_048862751.1 centrosomal protein of 68 kDa isoform X1 [Brienomyrus brachyistius]XP_048862752.1 centrosomal protein of 68 kDa isoform X1 [Brienomyrus brachyistius]XP_048862753.1 centrosomal protein of 68 kDa isoform X1 [Brienomyrus brachyistius]XP_048862754.1 centrosomal protein of 68 kDa isoform X1 [Brienomyrus brachyistius]